MTTGVQGHTRGARCRTSPVPSQRGFSSHHGAGRAPPEEQNAHHRTTICCSHCRAQPALLSGKWLWDVHLKELASFPPTGPPRAETNRSMTSTTPERVGEKRFHPAALNSAVHRGVPASTGEPPSRLQQDRLPPTSLLQAKEMWNDWPRFPAVPVLHPTRVNSLCKSHANWTCY